MAGIATQFISLSSDSLAITAITPNQFIHTGAGNDAVQLLSGINVVDGGTGSNFLTSGTGSGSFDTFFLDARNIATNASAAGPVPGSIWNTIANFHSGDAVSLFGTTGRTGLSWQLDEGAVGHKGLTLHATMGNGSEASVTFAGLTSLSQLTVSTGNTGSIGTGNSPYVYIKAN